MKRSLSHLLTAALVAAVALLPEPSMAAGPVLKLNAGLTAEILALGRDAHQRLTISMKISNNGPDIVYLLLLTNPPPFATSNTGETYYSNLSNPSGIAVCLTTNYAGCIGLPPSQLVAPFSSWTEIDPTTDIVVNFVLGGSSGNGPLVSFSANLAYRTVSNRVTDDTLSDSQKRQQVRTMTLSFPPMPVQEAR